MEIKRTKRKLHDISIITYRPIRVTGVAIAMVWIFRGMEFETKNTLKMNSLVSDFKCQESMTFYFGADHIKTITICALNVQIVHITGKGDFEHCMILWSWGADKNK